jgi:hypothetical protein
MLATIGVGTSLTSLGISIQTILVEYGDRPLVEALLLEDNQLLVPSNILLWITYSVVSVLVKQIYKNGFVLMHCNQPIISDTIVVWRAWVLLQQRRWLVILPLLLLLGSISK